nr:EVE domain-containing protein [Deinobacterium chartae]
MVKSEPDVFSYADLASRPFEPWNGVRNYQARNFLRAMQVGDGLLFYHSNTTPPGVAGVARVARAAYPDDLQFDPESPYFDRGSSPDNPRWSMVDVAAVAALPRFVSLEALRTLEDLEDLALLRRGNRLSVMPVPEAAWRRILEVGGLDPDEIARQLAPGGGVG